MTSGVGCGVANNSRRWPQERGRVWLPLCRRLLVRSSPPGCGPRAVDVVGIRHHCGYLSAHRCGPMHSCIFSALFYDYAHRASGTLLPTGTQDPLFCSGDPPRIEPGISGFGGRGQIHYAHGPRTQRRDVTELGAGSFGEVPVRVRNNHRSGKCDTAAQWISKWRSRVAVHFWNCRVSDVYL